MIAGVVAPDDSLAAQVIERLSRLVAAGNVADTSLSGGVGLACWGREGVTAATHMAGDHAYVGRWQGGVPGPTTELKGDFGLVARSGKQLLLARGRFGGRPVYFGRVGRATVACDRLLPLAALLRGSLRLNVDHLCAPFDGRVWAWLHPLPFESVASVPPNSIVEIDADGGLRMSRPALRLGPEIRGTEKEIARRLRDELCAAVERQSGGARIVGVLTGGGLDSGGVLGCAAFNRRDAGPGAVVAIALDHGGVGDDRPHLRALCSYLHIDPIRVTPAEASRDGGRERIVDGSIHVPLPASGLFSLTRSARRAGADVVLTGEGSELAFDSASEVFAEFLMRAPFSAAACLARFKGVDETRRQSVRRLAIGPLARAALPERLLQRRRRRAQGSRYPDWALPALTGQIERRLPEARRAPFRGQRQRVEQLAGSPLLHSVIDHLMRWETATGIRFAFPYLDDDFLQFAGRIPSAAIFAGNRERGLLRESLEGLVPDSHRYRPDKAGTHDAVVEQYRAMGGASSVRDLLTMRELGALGLVSPERFRKAFEECAEAQVVAPGSFELLWGAVAGEAYVRWFKEFNASGAAHAPVELNAELS